MTQMDMFETQWYGNFVRWYVKWHCRPVSRFVDFDVVGL